MTIIKGKSVIEGIKADAIKDTGEPKKETDFISSRNMTVEEAEFFKNSLKGIWG